MSTELLAIGTTALASSDFTVAAGQELIVYLKDATGPTVPLASIVHVQVKEGSEYFTLGTMTGKLNESAFRIRAPSSNALVGRLYREACTDAVGAASLS